MSEINLAFLFGAVFGVAVGYLFRVWCERQARRLSTMTLRTRQDRAQPSKPRLWAKMSPATRPSAAPRPGLTPDRTTGRGAIG